MKALWTQQPEYYFNQEVDSVVDNITMKTYSAIRLCLGGAPSNITFLSDQGNGCRDLVALSSTLLFSKFCLVPSHSCGFTPETKPQCWLSTTLAPKGATAAAVRPVLAEDKQLQAASPGCTSLFPSGAAPSPLCVLSYACT